MILEWYILGCKEKGDRSKYEKVQLLLNTRLRVIQDTKIP